MKRELSPWGRQCKIQMIFLGKKLKDISQETSLSGNYISSIINGRILPPEETVKNISEVLQVDASLFDN